MMRKSYQTMPPLTEEEYAALKADIAEHGCEVPVILDENGDILEGYHRVQICEELGIEYPVKYKKGLTELEKRAFARRMNVLRRHLNQAKMRAVIEDQLKEMPEGFNETTYALAKPEREEAQTVREKGIPALIDALARGTIAASAAADIAKLSPQEQERIFLNVASQIVEERAKANKAQRDEIRNQKIAIIPEGKYRDVVMDPGWPVQDKGLIKNPDGGPVDYQTMTVEEIRAWGLAVLPDITAPDCNLFLWTTETFLWVARGLAECWGFRVLGVFVWNKVTKKGHPAGTQDPGMPKRNCEFVVYGRKGSPDFTETKGLRWCFDGVVKLDDHSRKPDEFFEMIRNATSGPRVSLFDREAREGFAVGGNETDKFDEANRKAKESLHEAEELLKELGLDDEAAE
jgi:N6-adenosine-specific RNA methylase IME4